MNEEDTVLFPRNLGENFSSGFLHSELWGVGVSRYVATALVVALSPGDSDITRFLPWSPITTGNHFHLTEKISNLLRRLASLTFLIGVQAFQDPVRGELPHV